MSSNKIELKLKVIETPGHLSDHLCYLLHEKSKGQTQKYFMFTGDSVIGARSTFFIDYP